MRTAIIVSVTAERQLEIPPEIQEKLNPGDEYLIWQTEDSLLFKKINKPLTLEELTGRIETLGTDPEQPSDEEICQVVKEVRRRRATDESSS